MKDEIKEILDRAKNLKYKCDCCEEIAPDKYMMRNDKQTDNLIEAVYIIDKLLDYITNLQEIAEEHKNCTRKHWQQKCAGHCASEMIYKSRIDKAIEYGKELRLFDNESLEFEIGTNFINILNGDDLLNNLESKGK